MLTMPRPVHHTGSGRTHTIPTDWTSGPAAVVADTLTTSGCTVHIGEAGGDPVWNPVSHQVETPDTPAIYSGPAEIYLVTDGELVRMVVGDEVTQRVYGVKLPADATMSRLDPDTDETTHLAVGHVVRVVTDPDVDLVGKTLTVKAITRGSRLFSRLLLATLTD